MAHPSERVHDEFRSRSIGKGGTAPFNSKPATDDFHVDRSRLGHHDEWDPDVKNEYGGKGKYVPAHNSIRLNAISSMGDLRAKSSSAPINNPSEDTGSGPRCVPYPCPPSGVNPMYKKRSGE